MTRQLIVTASQMLGIGRAKLDHPRRRRTSPRLENLEARVSLSSVPTGVEPATLSPVFAPASATPATGIKHAPAIIAIL